MPKKHYLTFAAACLLGATGLSSIALAGTESAGKESKQPVAPAPAPSYISGDFGVTFVSEYISRGLVLNSQGAIAQPYLDLYAKVYDDPNGFISSVTAQIGFWADIADKPTGAAAGSTTRDWYEFDYTPGISIVFAKNFTLTTSYFEFDSPDDAFRTARSVNANLAYDDSGLLGAFALHPHFTVLYELGAPGAAGLRTKAWYFEPGVAPSYTFLKGSKYPITFTVPITVGLGDSRFYNGNNFGYVSAGATVAVPLAFIPAGYGSWTLTAGYTYYHLGSQAAFLTSPGDRDSRHVFSGAIGATF